MNNFYSNTKIIKNKKKTNKLILTNNRIVKLLQFILFKQIKIININIVKHTLNGE